MSGDIYAVDWNIQGDGVGSIGNAESAMQNEIDQVNRDGLALMGKWESASAKDAFTRRKQIWDQAAQEIHAALGTFKKNLGEAAEIAQQGETLAKGVLDR
ncbi:WXG100 family type VII secretion target [Cumulibacter manganitolerans]|uniref:WXG100 family type VII secretion target n=1 Tax=Cumulibacter manganitolerans TaxID=1884992 RepID=UPI0012964F90|nr:WXG100 family type VII secretion target [Cumulibacter manganitolerans]